MRVRILLGGTSVCSPSRVTDTVGTLKRFVANDLFQISQLPFGTADLKSISVPSHSNAGGIVSAILKLPQPLNNYGDYALLTYISNDATHTRIFLSSARPTAKAILFSWMDASCCSGAYLNLRDGAFPGMRTGCGEANPRACRQVPR